MLACSVLCHVSPSIAVTCVSMPWFCVSATPGKGFYPPGARVHGYNRGQKTFSVYRATGEDPGACEYHERAQCFAPWFIEGRAGLSFGALFVFSVFRTVVVCQGLVRLHNSSSNRGRQAPRTQKSVRVFTGGREDGRSFLYTLRTLPFPSLSELREQKLGPPALPVSPRPAALDFNLL